jgi:hypothetical protein
MLMIVPVARNLNHNKKTFELVKMERIRSFKKAIQNSSVPPEFN